MYFRYINFLDITNKILDIMIVLVDYDHFVQIITCSFLAQTRLK